MAEYISKIAKNDLKLAILDVDLGSNLQQVQTNSLFVGKHIFSIDAGFLIQTKHLGKSWQTTCVVLFFNLKLKHRSLRIQCA